MKNYNFEKAIELIKENIDNLESASLGMHEDWCWTAESIWEDGKFKEEFLLAVNSNTCHIGGIGGSTWATPTLCLEFKDGSDKMIKCHDNGESKSRPSFFELGVMSQPVQDKITPITKD